MTAGKPEQLDQSNLTAELCQQPRSYAWFLGAGASRSAGLPTASDILWDLKRRYYCREENQEISRQDTQNEAVRTKIQEYFDSREFPQPSTSDEYSIYFERMFGDDRERQRKYLKAILSNEKVTLSVGNRVLGALIAGGFSRTVFTTNFDDVVERAVAEVGGQSISAYHLEGARSALNALNNEEYPLFCKLHGDFRYDSLKNLSSDLEEQNEDLSKCFLSAAQRFGFIVVGYSGRDSSVMNLFRKALDAENPFPHGLFWAHMKGTPLLSEVQDLIDKAQGVGVNAQLIEIRTFDALMLHLWRNLDEKPGHLVARVQKTEYTKVDIPLPSTGARRPLLRFNALPLVSTPEYYFALSFHVGKDLAALQKAEIESKGGLVLGIPDGVWCWGGEEQARKAFGSELASVDVREFPKIAEPENFARAKGFMERGLARALVREKPLVVRNRHSSSYLIVRSSPRDVRTLRPLAKAVGQVFGVVEGVMTKPTPDHSEPEQVEWAEALGLSIELKDSRAWVVFQPDIWIRPPRSRDDAREFLDSRRGNRYNNKYNELISAWIEILLGTHTKPTEIEVSPFAEGAAAENPSFRIGSRSAYSRGLEL